MTEPTEVVQLDPRTLQDHPHNPRTDLGDLTGLTASIKAQGVLQNLTVVPAKDGGHVVLEGHRRKHAAIAADRPTVPCVIRDDLMGVSNIDLVDQLGAMLSENVHRRNLDAIEEARAVQKMIDFGENPTKIAKRTGLARKHVQRAAGVAQLDDETSALVVQAGLDLQQAAIVAEYRDDPAVAADLVEAAAKGSDAFTHRLTRAKQDTQRRAAYVAKETELREAGRVLVDDWSWDGPTNRGVQYLRDNKGVRLDPDEHRTCPGSAVFLEDHFQGPREIEVCTDWKANGHATAVTSGGSAKTPAADLPAEVREKQKQERRQLIEDNKAMQAANSTRRHWVRTVLLERRRGEKEVLRFAVEAMVNHRDQLYAWFQAYTNDDQDTALAELGLLKPSRIRPELSLTSGDKVTDARLPLQLLAHVAGAIEGDIGRDSHRGGTHEQETAAWLTFLAGQGYGLADIEQRIVDAAARRTTS